MHKITPWGSLSPTVDTTDLSDGKREHQTFLKKDLIFYVAACT